MRGLAYLSQKTRAPEEHDSTVVRCRALKSRQGSGDPAHFVSQGDVAFSEDLRANAARHAHRRQQLDGEVPQAARHEAAQQDGADLEGLLDEGGQRTPADHDIAPQRLSVVSQERLACQLPVHIFLDQRNLVGRQIATRKAAQAEIVAVAFDTAAGNQVGGRQRRHRCAGICGNL
ncbi:MAG TPA: hypothetical protein VF043_25085 [Ktedonobacteraceae bacterium]